MFDRWTFEVRTTPFTDQKFCIIPIKYVLWGTEWRSLHDVMSIVKKSKATKPVQRASHAVEFAA